MENRRRSLLKTLSWRIAATSTTILLVFLVTQSLTTSFGVGFLEVIVKTTVYYLHERMWNMLNFGRNHSPASPTKT